MKTRIAVATFALAAALAACGGGDDEAADAPATDTAATGTTSDSGTAPSTVDTSADATSGATLTMKDTKFSPASLSVKPGATVNVMNEDGFAHNVTADKAGIMTGDVKGGGSATFTAPKKAGTYDFECTIHPGMTGKLKVS